LLNADKHLADGYDFANVIFAEKESDTAVAFEELFQLTILKSLADGK
jgi:hypothetical protein